MTIVVIEPASVDASVARAFAAGISKVGTPPKGWIIVVKDSLQTATLTVFDQMNGLSRQVEVLVEGQVEVLVDMRLPQSFSLDMVWIEPGTFQMGSPSIGAGSR